ncbi:unnamed protein product [Anisakis simplex]|uniref:Uncharacterized protein n=1 Tax=Anisakis simplex TaxID=6269 RepID=A0A0M3JYU2_ANISI|nr:unnamed protein product [Anisakis simplex]
MSSYLRRAINCCFCAKQRRNRTSSCDDSDDNEYDVKTAIVPSPHVCSTTSNNKPYSSTTSPAPRIQRPFNWQLDLSTIFSESLEFQDEQQPEMPSNANATANNNDYEHNVCQTHQPALLLPPLQMSAPSADLERFLQRLELVTTRLEAISAQKPTLAPKPGSKGASPPAQNGW